MNEQMAAAPAISETVARHITTHHVNGCNEAIELIAGRIGAGNAPVRYDVFGPRKMCGNAGMVPSFGLNMRFQDGPVAENGEGVNGITNEVLLAIVRDRLECFQQGPYACEENAAALAHVVDASNWLKKRTMARVARGVEGTHQV